MAETERSGFCVAALVFGVLSLAMVPMILSEPFYPTLVVALSVGVLTVLCGVVGLRQVSRFSLRGAGMAVMGFLCAFTGTGLSASLFVVAMSVNAEM